MSERTTEHRWATVLNADVVGYSALAAEDDAAAMRALIGSIRWLAAVVDSFGGRVVDAPGDNLMAEFASEEAAVRCALYIHRRHQRRDAALSSRMPIRFRIGIHSGTLLARADRIYGNVVNIAARLQQAAPAGGLCISTNTLERVPSAFAAAFTDDALLPLRNIPSPVGAVRVDG